MSTPSPLQPQDALEGASTPKSRMRVTVLTILALHVVFIGGLLMQGCDKKSGTASSSSAPSASSLPSLGDTNYFSNFPGDTPGVVSGVPEGGGVPATGTSTGASAIPPVGTPPPAISGLPSGGSDPVGTLPSTTSSSVPPSMTGSTPGGGFGSLPVATTPSEPIVAGGGTEHVIKSGDTIAELAKRYGVTTQAIIDANPRVKPRNLKLDEKLTIPPPAPVSATSTPGSGSAVGGAVSAPGEGEVYIVRQGDNLTKIGKRFGVSVKALRAANNLRNDRIVVKQRLIIPAKPSAPSR